MSQCKLANMNKNNLKISYDYTHVQHMNKTFEFQYGMCIIISQALILIK